MTRFRWVRRNAEILVATAVFVTIMLLSRAITGSNGSKIPPTDAVTEVTGWALPLLISSLALGFLVMAIVQLIKPSLRAQFHHNQIARWLTHDVPPEHPLGPKMLREFNTDIFLQRVSHADPDALLELPIEQLAAQMQASLDVELASGEGLQFVESVIGPAGAHALSKLDEMSNVASDNAQSEESIYRRSALNHQVQRRLDALQIEVRHRWRRYLRLLCMFVSVTITSVLATIFGYWGNVASTALVVILLSALGSFFASVARDAVAILERLRT